MNRKMRNSFIKELNDKITEYVSKRDLFCGGCCYAAYILAEVLSRSGIDYKVILFESSEELSKDFNQSINNSGFGVDHIAIKVRKGIRSVIFGGLDGFRKYRRKSIRHYVGVTPEMILTAYWNNTWNETYQTHNNYKLKQEIFGICSKYGCGPAE